MPARWDILGLGTAFVDDILHVSSYPQADQKQAIASETRAFGGCVATALAAAARLGGRCAYLGVLGNDDLSAAMIHAFAQVGLEQVGADHEGAAQAGAAQIGPAQACPRHIGPAQVGAEKDRAVKLGPRKIAVCEQSPGKIRIRQIVPRQI